jgi:hypothetical protein
MPSFISAPYYTPLTSAFHNRFDALESAEATHVLKTCEGLQEFLPQVITFLEADDNARFAEDIAHYLMGKVDYLPDVPGRPDPPATPISPDVKTALYSLLRTHRHGIFGRKEEPAKTIEKLKALYDRVSSEGYLNRLHAWQKEALPGEEAGREKAVNYIVENTLRKNIQKVSLHGCALTSIPPLPVNIRFLDLTGDKFTSLKGMPPEMDVLRDMFICSNAALTTLVGMPEKLNALQTFTIRDSPSLTSLFGISQEMKELMVLVLEGNSKLASLDYLPKSFLEGNGARLSVYESPVVARNNTAFKDINRAKSNYSASQGGGMFEYLPGWRKWESDGIYRFGDALPNNPDTVGHHEGGGCGGG